MANPNENYWTETEKKLQIECVVLWKTYGGNSEYWEQNQRLRQFLADKAQHEKLSKEISALKEKIEELKKCVDDEHYGRTDIKKKLKEMFSE